MILPRKMIVIDTEDKYEDNCMMPNARKLLRFERNRLLKLLKVPISPRR